MVFAKHSAGNRILVVNWWVADGLLHSLRHILALNQINSNTAF
jgi:hypothetical protein